jgi:sulfhydrogenase subunit beta (sulfur reductase)
VARRSVITAEGLRALVATLRSVGYRVVGPRLRDGAIVHDDIESADDLPVGWTDAQDAGSYRVERTAGEARFGYAAGPHSWKGVLFPPRVPLWSARRDGGELRIEHEPARPEPLALLGVRGCDLASIAVLDRVLLGGRHVDEDYAARRAGTFVVAVECGEPAGTCFCASMGTGPGVEAGFDLALTEILDGGHRYLVRAGSERGEELLAQLPRREADAADERAAAAVLERAASRMGRRLETRGLADALRAAPEHPRWQEVADRCLTCGNCTLVCPTCFCTTVEDTADLTGERAERQRVWQSCFSLDHSYVNGGSVRVSPRSRYRQWLTHKLGTWHDQFGTSGCVGCGRCITWCPVGIDITEEAAAVRGGRDGG